MIYGVASCFYPRNKSAFSCISGLLVPRIAIGHLLAWYVIFDDITVLQVLAIVVSACGCNLAVLLLQSSYIGPKATNLRSFNESLYRHVFLVGLVGSLIISTVNGIFLYSPVGGRLLDPMMTLGSSLATCLALWYCFPDCIGSGLCQISLSLASG